MCLQNELCVLRSNGVNDLFSHSLSTVSLFEMSPVK